MRIDRTQIRRWIAYHLPRKLIYWCLERVIVFSTTGKYSKTKTDELNIVDAMKRWQNR